MWKRRDGEANKRKHCTVARGRERIRGREGKRGREGNEKRGNARFESAGGG